MQIPASVQSRPNFGQKTSFDSTKDLFKAMDNMAKDKAAVALNQERLAYLKRSVGEVNGQPVLVLHLLKEIDRICQEKLIFHRVREKQLVKLLGTGIDSPLYPISKLVELGLVKRKVPVSAIVPFVLTFPLSIAAIPLIAEEVIKLDRYHLTKEGKTLLATLEQQDKNILMKPFQDEETEGEQ